MELKNQDSVITPGGHSGKVVGRDTRSPHLMVVEFIPPVNGVEFTRVRPENLTKVDSLDEIIVSVQGHLLSNLPGPIPMFPTLKRILTALVELGYLKNVH